MSAFTPRAADALHPMAYRPPPKMTDAAKDAKVVWLADHAERLRDARRTSGAIAARWAA